MLRMIWGNKSTRCQKLEHLKAISQNILNFELFSILIFPNVKKNYLSK